MCAVLLCPTHTWATTLHAISGKVRVPLLLGLGCWSFFLEVVSRCIQSSRQVRKVEGFYTY